MKIITINLPEKYLAAIQVLVENGVYPSRSGALRVALREFLAKELKFNYDIDPESFKILVRSGRR